MEQSFPLGSGLCWAGLPLSHSLVLMNDGLIFLSQSLYLRRRRQSLKTMCSDSCIEILMYVLGGLAQSQLGIGSLCVQLGCPNIATELESRKHGSSATFSTPAAFPYCCLLS